MWVIKTIFYIVLSYLLVYYAFKFILLMLKSIIKLMLKFLNVMDSIWNKILIYQLKKHNYYYDKIFCVFFFKLKYMLCKLSYLLIKYDNIIRMPNKLSLFNIILIIVSIYLVDQNTAHKILLYSKEYLLRFYDIVTENKKYYFILFIPVIVYIGEYVYYNLKHYEAIHLLYNNILKFLSCLYENIKNINSYTLDNHINYLVNEITDNIGFKMDRDCILTKSKSRHDNNYIHRINLNSIEKLITEINFMIKNDLKDNYYYFKKLDIRQFVDVFFNEKYIIGFLEMEYIEKLHKFYEENSSLISKKMFTNVRIVREDRIRFLDYNNKSLEDNLKKYRKELIKYLNDNIIITFYLQKYRIDLYNFFITSNFFNRILSILKHSFCKYLKFIFYVIY